MGNKKIRKNGWPFFWNIQKQPSRGAQKNSKPKYFYKFQENVSRQVRHHLKGFWEPGNLTIRYCFSMMIAPLNPIGCSFEKRQSEKTSLIERKI